MAEKRFLVTGDQYRTIHRKMRGILLQLDHKKGSPLDPKLVSEALQNISEVKFEQSACQSKTKNITPVRRLVEQTKYFHLMPEVKNLRLGYSTSKLIVDAKDVFKSGIDSDFVIYDLNRPSQTCKPARISGYDLVKNGIFKDMFLSFGVDYLEKLWLRQGQVIDTCVFFADRLHQGGYASFFLIKKDEDKPATEENLFVVHVCVESNGLNAYVYHFSYDGDWRGGIGNRFFCPQLIALVA
jgi:hypothetical protein